MKSKEILEKIRDIAGINIGSPEKYTKSALEQIHDLAFNGIKRAENYESDQEQESVLVIKDRDDEVLLRLSENGILTLKNEDTDQSARIFVRAVNKIYENITGRRYFPYRINVYYEKLTELINSIAHVASSESEQAGMTLEQDEVSLLADYFSEPATIGRCPDNPRDIESITRVILQEIQNCGSGILCDYSNAEQIAKAVLAYMAIDIQCYDISDEVPKDAI